MADSSKVATKVDKDIYRLLNETRADPKSFVPHLQKLLECFDGEVLKREGKTNLRTNEGPKAVKEAISDDKVPLNLLSARDNNVNAVQEPRSADGRVPEILFLLRSMTVRVLSNCISSGIVPLNMLML